MGKRSMWQSYLGAGFTKLQESTQAAEGCLGTHGLLQNCYPAKGESMQKTPSIFKVRYKATGKEKHQTFLSSGTRNMWEDRDSAATFTLICDHTASRETNNEFTRHISPKRSLWGEKKPKQNPTHKPSLQLYSQRYSHIILWCDQSH